MLVDYKNGVCRCTCGEHLTYANVLVISHIWFNISLLGFGAPFLGHHFQVQVTCHLQDHSLGGLEAEVSVLVVLYMLYVFISKPRA